MKEKSLRELTRERIKTEEGYRSKPYKDRNVTSIGYGFNMDEPQYKKLAGRGLNHEQMLDSYIDGAISGTQGMYNAFGRLHPSAQQALVDMYYQLGPNKLKGFKRMNEALSKGDYKRASAEALDSDYAKQTPNRAKRNSQLLMGI